MCAILDRWLCIFTGIAGAVLASQLPAYCTQYMQNLRGRLDELEPIVEEFELDVMQYNYTLDEALEECEGARGLLDALCSSFEDIVMRYEDLLEHYLMLNNNGDYKRPFALMGSARSDIARSVADEFEPAIPTSDQGFVYAGVGFLLCSGALTFLFGALRCMCCRPHRPRRRARKNQEDPVEPIKGVGDGVEDLESNESPVNNDVYYDNQ